MAPAPHTEQRLAEDLAALGVRPGETLLVQASSRSIGPVEGGSTAVVRALRAALGPAGTLVAYTATPENSHTSRLHRERTRGMDGAQLAAYLAAMPPFDPAATPASPTLGRLAEEIRITPGAVRSNHPQTSFAAVGPAARRITARHDLDCHLGERSPVGELYRSGARALLIGVPIWCCTAYHLADYWGLEMPSKHYTCRVKGPGGVWQDLHFEAPDLDDEHFAEMGEEIRREVPVVRGPLGDAQCWLVPVTEAVDVATRWLLHRQEGPGGRISALAAAERA